jgi:paraquat-inducible protein B
MSGSGPTENGSEPSQALAEPVVGGKRSFSPIWIIPIVVVIVAASFAYRAIQEEGPKVVVLFDSAEGLTAGKSKVKYRDVEIGDVDGIAFRGIDQVEVQLSLHPGAARYVTEDTQWWVVRPRIGGGGISGLETILSGGYVTFEPGTEGKKEEREFVGLEEPPIPAKDRPGVQLTLVTDELRGVDVGAAIFFRDIDVGDVLHYALAEDGKTVEIKIVVRGAHAGRVTSASRFWNAGGFELSVGAGGLDVKTESIQSILSGGIAFDSPGGGKPAKAGDRFWLHHSMSDVQASEMTHGGLGLVLETGSLGGVAAGNPVYFREVPVGSVVSHELSKDGLKVRIQLNIQRRYASLVRSNTVFWNASGISADLGLTGLHVHAESLRSLLEGGVAFATPPKLGHTVKDGSVFRLHPEAKKKWLEWETDYTAKADDPPEKHSALGRFFHHESKTAEKSKQEDATPELNKDEHKHGFLSGLFRRGD